MSIFLFNPPQSLAKLITFSMATDPATDQDMLYQPPLVESMNETETPIELTISQAQKLVEQGRYKERVLSDYKSATDDYYAAINTFSNAINSAKKLKSSPSIKAILAEAYGGKAFTYYLLDDYSSALADYDLAIEFSIHKALYFHERGMVNFHLGRYKSAALDFDKVIELEPNDATAYFRRGVIREKIADYLPAIQDLTRAISLNPQLAEAYNERGAIKLAWLIGNQNQDYAKGSVPSPYKAIEMTEGYMRDLNQAIELLPNYATAYYNRGRAYQYHADFQKARLDMLKTLELQPENLLARYWLGQAKLGLKDYQGSLKDFEELLPAAQKLMQAKIRSTNDKGIATAGLLSSQLSPVIKPQTARSGDMNRTQLQQLINRTSISIKLVKKLTVKKN